METINDQIASMLHECQGRAFTPYADLDEAADALTVYFANEPDYAKRLNDHITIYLSLDTDDIVGCRVKGIRDIVNDLPNYIDVNTNGIGLSIVFLACRTSSPEENETINRLAVRSKDKGMVLNRDR